MEQLNTLQRRLNNYIEFYAWSLEWNKDQQPHISKEFCWECTDDRIS